jgi:hypothetical protein
MPSPALRFLPLSNDRLKLHAIEHLCIGNFSLARFFFKILPSALADEILDAFLTSSPPSIFIPNSQVRSAVRLAWAAHQIRVSLCEEDDRTFSAVDSDFTFDQEGSVMRTKYATALRNAMSEFDRNPQDEARLLQLGAAFMTCLAKCRPLAAVFLPQYESFFAECPTDSLLSAFKYPVFELFSSPDNINFASVSFSYSNVKEYQDLFQIPLGYERPELFAYVQSRVFAGHFYPDSPPYESDRVIRSLAGTAVLSCRHFVDLLRTTSLKDYKAGNYAAAYRNADGGFDSIGMWIFLAHACNEFEEKFPLFNASLPEIGDTSKSIAADFIQRHRNDVEFFSMLRRFAGQILTKDDLVAKSVPSYLVQFLVQGNTAPFDEFYRLRLFCLTDADRGRDCDFVYSYFALDAMLGYLGQASINMDDADRLEGFVQNVQSIPVRRAIVMDIFSLIFLQKDERYLCPIKTADLVLTSILNYAEDPRFVAHARAGVLHLQLAKMFASGDGLEQALTPRDRLLLSSLEQRDWEIAKSIAANNPSDQPLVSLFRAVENFRETEKVDFGAVGPLTAAEIALSFAHPEGIPEIPLTDLSQYISRAVAGRRQRGRKDPMKSLRVLKYMYRNSLLKKFKSLGATVWEVPSLPPAYKGLVLLYSFCQYLDKLVPVLLKAGERDMVRKVADVLAMTPYQNLKQLLREEKMREAEELAIMLQQDLLDLVLHDGGYPPAVTRYLTAEFPVVGVASVIVSSVKCPENLVQRESACRRLFAIRMDEQANVAERGARAAFVGGQKPGIATDSWERRRETSFALRPEGLAEADTIRIIDGLFREREVNIDAVVELSFCVSSDRFSKLLFDSASNANIKAIGRIIQRCAIDGKTFDALNLLVNLDRDGVSPFPVTVAVRTIIGKKWFDRAAAIVRAFDDICDFFPVLIDCLRSAQDKLAVYRLSERLRPRLLRELGVKEIELGNVFLDAIPPEWRTSGQSPEQTVAAHLQNDLDKCVEVLRQFDSIDVDAAFVTTLRGLSKTEEIVARVTQFLPTCRSPDALADAIAPLFERQISRLVVVDLVSEDAAVATISDVAALWSHFQPTEFARRIDVLRAIADRRPYAVHKLSYAFTGFGAELLPLCASLDLTQELEQLSLLWNIQPSALQSVRDAYTLRCFAFSHLTVPDGWRLSRDFFLKLVPFFTRPRFVDPGFVEPFANLFPPTESLLTMSWRLSQKVYGRSPVYDFFMARAPVELVVRCASEEGDFTRSVAALRNIRDRDTRIAVFRRDVAEVAVGSNRFEALRTAMGDNADLFDALGSRGPYLGLYLAEFRQEYHQMCDSALRLYSECVAQRRRDPRQAKRALDFLNLAESALKKISDPTEADTRRRIGIGLQRRYLDLQIKRGLVALNMLDNETHRGSMVVQLLNLGEFDFAREIIANYEMDVQELGGKVNTLPLDDDEGSPVRTVAFLKRFQAWENVMNNAVTFWEILYGIVTAVVFTLRRLPWVPVLAEALDDRFIEYRVRVLAQFGFLEEAAAIAERACPSLIPLIGNYAQLWAKTAIVDRAMKFLEQMAARK